MQRPSFLVLTVLLLLAACSAPPATQPSVSASDAAPTVSASAPLASEPLEPPDLVPPDGTAWFGMNLDWANDSVADVGERLGATPSVWVQFVAFPLDAAGRGNLEGFFEQVSAAHGIGLVTLEPHEGLATVTADAAAEMATLLDAYWRETGVPSIVRFAHEMNGTWYPWGQQPAAYVEAYRTVADAVHELAPASAMAWAPNEGSGYPFTGGAYTGDDPALDTNGDGTISNTDDPYAPYWPGDDAVDWVGMSLYHWGVAYPWGENELPPAGSFRALLTGHDTGAHADRAPIPDFYAVYATGHAKPMGVFETAALFNPNAPGPTEEEIKSAWWAQLTEPAIAGDFPALHMINWFEWRKDEPEVQGIVDWRLTSDPAFARSLLDASPEGWLLLGGLPAD